MKKIILGLMILCSSIFADKITVFAASDLKFALDEIKEKYTSVNKDIDINLIYGSSGKGMNQIERDELNGLPMIRYCLEYYTSDELDSISNKRVEQMKFLWKSNK